MEYPSILPRLHRLLRMAQPHLTQRVIDSLDLPQKIEYSQIAAHNVGGQQSVEWRVDDVVEGEDVPALAALL